jgi:hypothetical protein
MGDRNVRKLPVISDSTTSRPARAQTTSIVRLAKRELRHGMIEYPPEETASYADQRPRTRAECIDRNPRPCPWVSCKHHLYLDVHPRNGSIKVNFPDREVADMPETCALDIADAGGTTLEDIAALLNLTRERIRQIEADGFRAILATGSSGLRLHLED